MSGESNMLEQRLRDRWRRARNYELLRGGAVVLAVLVLLIFVDLALDWSLQLPPAARLALLLANLIVLGAVAYAYILRRVHRYDPLREALREEADTPGLDSLFVSYLQLNESDAPDRVSAGLIRMTRRQAEQQVQRHAFGRSIRFERLRKLIAAAGGALVVLLVAVVLLPATFGALAQRMLVPFGDVRYPTDTRLAMISGDMHVRQYDPVTVTVTADGEVPGQGQLLTRTGDGGWERTPITRGPDNTFSHTLASVGQSLAYRFEVGDAQSPVHRITAVPPPQIAAASVTLDYPDYTEATLGTSADQVSRLNVEAPEGTVVRWELTLDAPVKKATLVVADGRSIPVQLSDGGRMVRASLEADASLAYRYRFDWTLNGQRQENESARHFIQVIPDVPPRVAISYPLSSSKATLAKQLGLEFNAADDYAISQARLVYSLNDGTEQVRELNIGPGGAGNVDQQVQVDPNELVPDLREGDVLNYRIEVTDNRELAAGPQQAASQLLRLVFVSEDEYLQDVADRRSRLLGQLRPIYQQERQAYDNLIGPAAPAEPREQPTP